MKIDELEESDDSEEKVPKNKFVIHDSDAGGERKRTEKKNA